jgi:hypothetical protein
MKKINLMDRYPVYTKEILKSNTKFKNVDDFINALKEKVMNDEVATYIGIFDHYTHTKGLE